jgi:urocanate reductase
MKRVYAIVLMFVMLSTLTLPAMAESYTGTAKGFGGDVTVTLEIADGKLTKIAITGDSETPGIGTEAIKQMPDKMIEANSISIDSIAGATVTSTAIKEAAAAALAGVDIKLNEAPTKAAELATLPDETTDVLVIGGGAAGLTAAIAAAEAGAKAILIEKLSFLGGSTAMSGGVMARAAIPSDPDGTMNADELYKFFMDAAGGKADPEVVRTYVDKSAEDFAWVYQMGGGITKTDRFPVVPETIMALYPAADTAVSAGAQLIDHMRADAEDLGVSIRTLNKGESLLVEDGRVVGAKVTVDGKATQNIYAKGGVVIATGGFACSPELLAKYSTKNAEKIVTYAGAGTVGDGLIMCEEAGAAVRFGEGWDTNGSFSLAFTGYGTGKMLDMVLLNSNGERFFNEAKMQPEIFTAMREQVMNGNLDFYFLTDDTIEKDTQWLLDNAEGFKAANFEELSEKTGMPIENLKKTFDAYNAVKGTGNDPLGKTAPYSKGIQFPVTVIKTFPIRTCSIGGLVINKEAEVLNESNTAIPGLYAAGEVANYSFMYDLYASCGSAVQHAVTFGRIAGTNAAKAK